MIPLDFSMQKVFIKPIAHLEASRQLAQRLHEDYLSAEPNFVLLLEGGLGVGKTFMTQEILKCFEVMAEVTSPTYALVNEYENNAGQQFAHFDFYRLEDPQDFFARGFTDIAGDAHINCILEWPEKISDLAIKNFSGTIYKLRLEFEDGTDKRTVTLLK